VNHRLANQDKRIHQDVKNGTLTKAQAALLNSQENNISSQIPPK
jgi:hypothetical protein